MSTDCAQMNRPITCSKRYLTIMRLFIQRAASGSVTVDGQVIGQSGKGIVCLVGIHRDDVEDDLDASVAKLLAMKLWEADDGTEWKKTISDIDGELLLVSQFTLHARVSNGRRPDFSRAMGSGTANDVFLQFVEKVRAAYKAEKVQTGSFGADMDVKIVNDGPATFMFDTFSAKAA